MNFFTQTILLIVFLSYFYVSCVELLLRAYIPKQSKTSFYNLVETQTDIDLWLSTRILSKTQQERFSINGSYEYFAEFRLKDDTRLYYYKRILTSKGIKIEVLVDDIYKVLKHEREKRSVSENDYGSIVGKYVSFNRITEWMKDLEREYPRLISIQNIGKSVEGRDLLVLVLSDKNSTILSKKLAFIESGIHAREWISIATSIYMIDKFIQEFLTGNIQSTRILKAFEIHFLVVLNPDGYEYSRKSPNNRFWRKNMKQARSFRQPYNSGCRGVDLNRNFDIEWMTSGSSSQPCSETYAGTGPNSESEIDALSKYVLGKSPNWSTYIALHSYGQLWLAPYSFTSKKLPDNFHETCTRALSVISKIKHKFKTEFTFGSAAYTLYESSGTSEDWAQIKANISNSYVIELHPNVDDIYGDFMLGFDYPENELTQACGEIFFGFKEYFTGFVVKRKFPNYIHRECKLLMNKSLHF